MVNTQRYFLLSFVSGCIWAGIGYFLGRELFNNQIWVAVIASPLIGLVAGYTYLRISGKSFPARIVASLERVQKG